jgi:tRNA(adenine34) deaminase
MFDKMDVAIKMAQKAYDKSEVPVGAAIFKDGVLISKAHNECVSQNSSLAHAEIIAIQKALKKLGCAYLNGCEIYVTVEPCMMCMGSILNSRISKLVYGAYEPKTGFADSAANIKNFSAGANIEIYGGICEDKCGALMSSFFDLLRNRQ